MTQKSELVVATWNLEWAPAQSTRGREMHERLAACNADVIFVTEGQTDNLPGGGDIIASEADYGYPLREGRRKVILWTRHKWIERDPVDSRHLPPGRFAAGILSLDQAEVRVVGVWVVRYFGRTVMETDIESSFVNIISDWDFSVLTSDLTDHEIGRRRSARVMKTAAKAMP